MHPLVVSSLLLLATADPAGWQDPASPDPIRELADHVRHATVEVAAKKLIGTRWVISHGAGTILDANGVVLTCKHVIRDYPSITITTHDGNTHVGRLLYQDEEVDLAILEFETTKEYRAIEMGGIRGVRPGELALYAGYPERGQRSLARGRIVGTSNRVDVPTIVLGTNLLRFSGLVETGFSGGPIVSLDGKLLGVVAARGRLDHEIGYAVPTSLVLRSLERHLRQESDDFPEPADHDLLAHRDRATRSVRPPPRRIRQDPLARLVSK